MKLIYISQGNIPSKWAHTFQAMKMAEAFAQLIPDFRLLTQVHWSAFLRRRFDYESWYGLRKRFRIARIVVLGLPRVEIFDGVRYPRFDNAAVRYSTRKRPDMILTRSEHAGELCVKRGIPSVIETHISIENHHFEHVRAVARNAFLRGVVTISDVLKEMYVSVGIPENKILVLADAVNLDAFIDLPNKEILRQKLKLPQNKFISAYCGHLYRNRGVEEIVDSAAKLQHIFFLVVGGLEEDVKKYKEKTKHFRNMLFTGFVPNKAVPEYLAAADVLLMPYTSRCETADWMSPLKLFEYMASRRPIVGTDLSAIRKHLENARNAVLVAPDSGESLASAIQSLERDKRFADQIAWNAWEDVQQYTWLRRAQCVLETFGHGYPVTQ